MQSYQFLASFNDALNLLTARYGLNKWLAKALAVGLFAPLAWGIRRGFFKVTGHTWRTRFITGVYGALYFLGMYAVSRGASFAHSTGEVLQWYAETPEGVRFFDSPGYDPKYGLKLQPVTSDLRVALERQRLGQIPQEVPLTSFSSLQLFDPVTGAPRYWAYRSTDGSYQLFNGPGFHPRNQQLLVAVNPQIAEDIAEWTLAAEQTRQRAHLAAAQSAAQQNRLDYIARYIDRSVTRGNAKQWTVLLINGSQELRSQVTSAMRDALAGGGAKAISLFRQSVDRDGLSPQLYDGNASLITRLALDEKCDGILAAKLTEQLSSDPGLQGMVTATVAVSVRLIHVPSGQVQAEFEVTERGAGFSEASARRQAAERAALALKDRLARVAW